MDEKNQVSYPPTNVQQPLILPNSTAALVLGIVSIASLCCCSIVGFVLGIIGLVLGVNAMALYHQSPDVYSEASFKNANAGKICSIIGLAFGVIKIVQFIIQWPMIREIIQAAMDGTLDPSDYSTWF